jgi:hypothetical protein
MEVGQEAVVIKEQAPQEEKEEEWRPRWSNDFKVGEIVTVAEIDKVGDPRFIAEGGEHPWFLESHEYLTIGDRVRGINSGKLATVLEISESKFVVRYDDTAQHGTRSVYSGKDYAFFTKILDEPQEEKEMEEWRPKYSVGDVTEIKRIVSPGYHSFKVGTKVKITSAPMPGSNPVEDYCSYGCIDTQTGLSQGVPFEDIDDVPLTYKSTEPITKEDTMESRATRARRIKEEEIPELKGQVEDINAKIADLEDKAERLDKYPSDDAEKRDILAKLVGVKTARDIETLKEHGITVSINASAKNK